ncbi:hypothetical protein VNO78_21625 [Psophocarpus tetragonolobus]|uniref:Uncharacterized protein n=1 Tax=Psophocarpus tetragonolobus TaxID=3891 RepID=A0AAN9SGV0_PSOTE
MTNLHGGGGGTKGYMLDGGERKEGFNREDAAQMRIKKKVTKWANDLEGEMAICTLAPKLFRCGEAQSGGFLQVVLSMAKGDDSILKISVQEDPMLKSPSRYVMPSISKYEDPPPELTVSAFLLPHSFFSDQFDMLLTMGKVGDFVLDEG